MTLKKRHIAKILTAALTASILAGCGGGNSASTALGTQDSGAQENSAQAGESQAAAEEAPAEIRTVNMITMGIGNTADYKAVQDAINEISRPEIGVELNWTVLDIGQWFEQYNLLLSGSEAVDLMPNFGGVASGVAQGSFLELEDLYAQYGQGIAEYYDEDFLKAGYINGHLYGIAPQKDFAATKNITYRQDIVEKLGIDVSGVKTLEDWTPVLKAVKEAYPDMYAYVSNGGSTLQQFDTFDWDTMTDGLGVLLNYGQDTTVVDLYASDEYQALCSTMREWYEAGYTDRDTATSTQTGGDLMKAGKAFCTISTGNPGTEAEYEANTGYDCGTIALTDPLSSTGNVTAMMWGIPSFASEPEAAMEFLNLMYTNKEVSDLLNYGIKDVHYQVNEDGSYGYIGGDASACTYHPEMTWIWPNSYIGGFWNGREADLGEKMMSFNKDALKSKAMGFVYDNTNVVNEVTACSNVVKQYAVGLECGAVDPETVLPEFRKALQDAGIEKIIAEKQSQLDAWLNQ